MTLSHLLIAIVLFLLVLNVIFRLRIIRKYRALSNKQINIEPGLLFDRKKMHRYAKENYPQYIDEIEDFRQSLSNLLQLGIWGLLCIVIIFLLMKFI